jgi:hypothetical protein
MCMPSPACSCEYSARTCLLERSGRPARWTRSGGGPTASLLKSLGLVNIACEIVPVQCRRSSGSAVRS